MIHGHHGPPACKTVVRHRQGPDVREAADEVWRQGAVEVVGVARQGVQPAEVASQAQATCTAATLRLTV